MRGCLIGIVFVLATIGTTANVGAQSPDDVRKLKEEINDLRKQVSNLEKENELLKREIELNKREAKTRPDSSASRSKAQSEPLATASMSGVDYEIVKCVRKGPGIVFTFSARCDMEDRYIGGGNEFRKYSLLLVANGGEEITKGKTTSSPSQIIKLTKGIASKFQMTYSPVDPDITEFDEVILNEMLKLPVKFHNVKIEPVESSK